MPASSVIRLMGTSYSPKSMRKRVCSSSGVWPIALKECISYGLQGKRQMQYWRTGWTYSPSYLITEMQCFIIILLLLTSIFCWQKSKRDLESLYALGIPEYLTCSWMNRIEMKKMLFLDFQGQVLKYFTASSNRMLIEVKGNFASGKV